jgi:hypothetical protein
MRKEINKEITNTGEVCLNCHKRKGLHKTDKEGNHLYCYMDDSLDEFVGKNELKMNIEKEITICYNRIRDLKQQLKKLGEEK